MYPRDNIKHQNEYKDIMTQARKSLLCTKKKVNSIYLENTRTIISPLKKIILNLENIFTSNKSISVVQERHGWYQIW
jgi:hypothetical protein